VRVSAELGVDASLTTNLGTAAVLSRDGQMLAFVAQAASNGPSLLYVRRLDQLQARALNGTEDARSPFFSPDGQAIAFFAGGKLKKVSLSGGAPIELADAPVSRGGAWAEDGTIVFLPVTAGGATFVRISEKGGSLESLRAPDAPPIQGSQRWPQVLPGGQAILYTRTSPVEGMNLFAQVRSTGEQKSIQADAGYGRYLESGHLVFVRQSRLFAGRFDLSRLEWLSEPVPVVDGIAVNTFGDGAQFSVSDTGTLVFLPGAESNGGASPIMWLDASGKATPLGTSLGGASASFALSPDGDKVALDVLNGSNQDIAVYDLTRGVTTPLTVEPSADLRPVWTPDGHRIAFRSTRGTTGSFGLLWQRADGTGDVQSLLSGKADVRPSSFHPNGKVLAFAQSNDQTNSDIMLLPIEGDDVSGWKPGTPTPFANTAFAESEPMFSPDGKWLAFQSGETGRTQIHVRPFPGPGRGWIVSNNGGISPTWSRTRQELFYAQASDQRIMVVPYTIVGDAFRPDRPRPWTDVRVRMAARMFDLPPDGKRVAATLPEEPVAEGKKDKVVFIFNFFEELRRQLPVGGR
jgi:serine/threonine-protein kinase